MDETEGPLFPSMKDDEDERDTPGNPYDEPGFDLPHALDKRVHLEEENHEYLIIDGLKAYPGRIISGSSFYDFLTAVRKKSTSATEKYFAPSKVADFPTLLIKLPEPAPQPRANPESKTYAMALGTLFHWYAEQRIKGHTPEVPEAISREVKMFEKFFTEVVPPGFFCSAEVSLASFKHKACGTIDALHFNPVTKRYTIFDWKMSGGLFEVGKRTKAYPFLPGGAGYTSRYYYRDNVEISPGVRYRVYYPVKYTRTLLGYTTQQAHYRKLGNLNSMPCNTTIYIPVVHHTFIAEDIAGEPELRLIGIDLADRIPDYGIPIDAVQYGFHKRERIFRRLLGLKKESSPVKEEEPSAKRAHQEESEAEKEEEEQKPSRKRKREEEREEPREKRGREE